MKTPVPPQSLGLALAHVRKGGLLFVPTYTRVTVITRGTIDKWAAAGLPFLREDGNGYRMRTGRKSSVYLLPGQLRMID